MDTDEIRENVTEEQASPETSENPAPVPEPIEIEDDLNSEKEEKKAPKKHKWILFVLIAVLVLAVAAAAAWFFLKRSRQGNTPDRTLPSGQADESADEENPTETEADKRDTLMHGSADIETVEASACITVVDVSDIVEKTMPCVVAISDKRRYTSTYNPYSYFFGGGGRSSTEEGVASGSGVIIGTNETELLIVTNNHVVDVESESSSGYTVESEKLTVEFADGTSVDATIKGMDEQADLAVISVNLNDLTSETKDAIRIAVIGNSDSLKIGQGVVAIGNAGGYGQSVTAGIISAKDREVTIDNITRELLQTDAAINPGNSGGGLFNAKGELIGINSAKTVSTDIEGMGFAIPITYAETIIEDLMNRETLSEEEMGYLGIKGETIPSNYIELYGYPEGVSVTQITENSPAETCGLQIYDIITEVNGRKVKTITELKKLLNSYKAGTEVEITYMRTQGRGFKEMKTKATLVSVNDLPETEDTESESPSETEKIPDGGSNFNFGWPFDDFFGW